MYKGSGMYILLCGYQALQEIYCLYEITLSSKMAKAVSVKTCLGQFLNEDVVSRIKNGTYYM